MKTAMISGTTSMCQILLQQISVDTPVYHNDYPVIQWTPSKLKSDGTHNTREKLGYLHALLR